MLSWSKIAAPLEKDGRKAPPADVIALALKQLGLRRVEVPQSFPLGLAMELDARGIRLDLGPDPFWPEREIKAPHEVRAIEASLRAAEAGLAGRDRGAQGLPDPQGLAVARRAEVHGRGPALRGQHADDGRRLPALPTRSARRATRRSTRTRRATARSARTRRW